MSPSPGSVASASFAATVELLPRTDPLTLVLIVLVVMELLIPTWVYYDAKKREMDAAVWFHASLVPAFNVFGLLGYLATRKSRSAAGGDGADENEAVDDPAEFAK